MDETTLDAYFARLAVPRPHTADAVNLHVLHRAHQMTVPFENLSIHLGEPIVLAEHDLMHKIVHRRRGGFCYELNGAMAILLETMGAQVRRVAARVYGEGQAGPPFDHMALVVQATDASGPWLIDVGFGSHSVYPLLYDSQARAGRPGRAVPARRHQRRRCRRAQGRQAAVPDRAARTLPGRLRAHLLVAGDLTRLAFHPQHDLLPADQGRPDLHQRSHPDHERGRRPHRNGTGRRRRHPDRVPRALRHRPGPGPPGPVPAAARARAPSGRPSGFRPSGGRPFRFPALQQQALRFPALQQRPCRFPALQQQAPRSPSLRLLKPRRSR